MWEAGDRLFRKAHSRGRPGDSLFKCLTAVMILHPDLSDASLPGETRPLVVGSGVRGLKPNRVRKGLNPTQPRSPLPRSSFKPPGPAEKPRLHPGPPTGI